MAELPLAGASATVADNRNWHSSNTEVGHMKCWFFVGLAACLALLGSCATNEPAAPEILPNNTEDPESTTEAVDDDDTA